MDLFLVPSSKILFVLQERLGLLGALTCVALSAIFLLSGQHRGITKHAYYFKRTDGKPLQLLSEDTRYRRFTHG